MVGKGGWSYVVRYEVRGRLIDFIVHEENDMEYFFCKSSKYIKQQKQNLHRCEVFGVV